jgi:hypothetical protein
MPMAILKVVILALAFGFLFTGAGLCLLDGIEKAAGKAGTLVIMGMGGIGLLLGAIAGAAQAVVDALKGLSGE